MGAETWKRGMHTCCSGYRTSGMPNTTLTSEAYYVGYTLFPVRRETSYDSDAGPFSSSLTNSHLNVAIALNGYESQIVK